MKLSLQIWTYCGSLDLKLQALSSSRSLSRARFFIKPFLSLGASLCFSSSWVSDLCFKALDLMKKD